MLISCGLKGVLSSGPILRFYPKLKFNVVTVLGCAKQNAFTSDPSHTSAKPKGNDAQVW